MFVNRTFFALVFASAMLIFTAIWGQNGLTIDPDGRQGAVSSTQNPNPPLTDGGLTIDPDGAR
jgi:hypothetical protein